MKFSIVTLSFNQGKFLEEAILSVIRQDYPDIEYIIVDPGSTDGSREIIEKYRRSIAKIIFEEDNGPADGLNKGFRAAKGDILGYINADDYYEPAAFTHVAEIFKNKQDVAVVNGAIRIVDGRGRAKWRRRMSDAFDLENFAEGMCWVGQQATFFRKTVFGNPVTFNSGNRTCWDAEFLVDLALNGCLFHRHPKVLGNFRVHEGSITGSGRLESLYRQDIDRIRKIISRSITRRRPGYVNALLRVMYKFDIRRQFMNYTVR